MSQSTDTIVWISGATSGIGAALARASIATLGAATRAAMETVYKEVSDFDAQSRLLLAVAVSSPEFAVA